MKKIIVLISLIMIGLFALGIFFLRERDFIVLPISQDTELIFISSWSTAIQVLKDYDCILVVNGSYFWYDEDSNFIPAWIRYDEEKKYEREDHPFDPNLTNSIIFDKRTSETTFLFDSMFSWDFNSNQIIFNAWPYLLKDKTQNTSLKKITSHWQHPVPRTVIAKKGDKSYLILSKKGMALKVLANKILKLWFTDAINLDWGPSTSLASKYFFIKNYNTKEKLPIFWCIK